MKKHHHKHNLKHRYELLETLGRGTYGKVKKAIERHSGREVSQAEALAGCSCWGFKAGQKRLNDCFCCTEERVHVFPWGGGIPRSILRVWELWFAHALCCAGPHDRMLV